MTHMLQTIGAAGVRCTGTEKRGIQDALGREPGRAMPKGDALRAAGTANQTKLVGQPVQDGAGFDALPA